MICCNAYKIPYYYHLSLTAGEVVTRSLVRVRPTLSELDDPGAKAKVRKGDNAGITARIKGVMTLA